MMPVELLELPGVQRFPAELGVQRVVAEETTGGAG